MGSEFPSWRCFVRHSQSTSVVAVCLTIFLSSTAEKQTPSGWEHHWLDEYRRFHLVVNCVYLHFWRCLVIVNTFIFYSWVFLTSADAVKESFFSARKGLSSTLVCSMFFQTFWCCRAFFLFNLPNCWFELIGNSSQITVKYQLNTCYYSRPLNQLS